MVTAFQLIPLGTAHAEHIQIAQDIISLFANKFLPGRQDRIDYSIESDFLVKLSNLVLSSAERYVPLFLSPLIDDFNNLEVLAELFKQFIIAEDSLNAYESFWTVWEMFYDKAD